MTKPILYLSASTDAVDASLLTKRDAVLNFLKTGDIKASEIAAIGDSENDLPFIEIDGLGLIGTPANAQERVKERLRSRSNYVAMQKDVFEGFLEFFDLCVTRGIRHIISDRDGVLIWKGASREETAALRKLLLGQSADAPPTVTVLTGSSVEQNTRFINDYSLNDKACCSRWVLEHPQLIWAENGSAVMNVLTGQTQVALPDRLKPAGEMLKGSFEQKLLMRIEHDVLRPEGLTYSFSQDDQISKVYLPKKETMVTLNMPHVHNGIAEFRKSKEVIKFQKVLLGVMQEVAAQSGFEPVLL